MPAIVWHISYKHFMALVFIELSIFFTQKITVIITKAHLVEN
jgi:hypothetical protein